MSFGRMKRRKQKTWIAGVLAGGHITREQTQQILDIQMGWPPEEANLPLIRACWLALHPGYEEEGVPGEEDIEGETQKILRRIKEGNAPRPQRRPAAIAALALTGALLLSLAAQAMGLKVWDHIFGWNDEQLNITVWGDGQDKSLPAATMPPGYDTGDAFRKALIDQKMYPRLPAFVPEGFSLDRVEIQENGDGYIFVGAQYKNGERVLMLYAEKVILDENAVMSIFAEKDEGEMEIFEKGGLRFFLYTNLSHVVLDWFERPYMMSISGEISREDMREMMYSIVRGGISNE